MTVHSMGSHGPNTLNSIPCMKLNVDKVSVQTLRHRLTALQNLIDSKLAGKNKWNIFGAPPCKAIRELYWVFRPGDPFLPGDRLGLLIWEHNVMKCTRKLLDEHEKRQQAQPHRLLNRSRSVGNDKPNTYRPNQHQINLFPCSSKLSNKENPAVAKASSDNKNFENDEYYLPSSEVPDARIIKQKRNRHLTPDQQQINKRLSTVNGLRRRLDNSRFRTVCPRLLCHSAADH